MCRRRAAPAFPTLCEVAVVVHIPATSYQLLIELRAPARCTIGRLGTFDFPAGRYVYTGSARRAFEARIGRHLRGNRHWHTTLLAAPGRIVESSVRAGPSARSMAPRPGSPSCRASARRIAVRAVVHTSSFRGWVRQSGGRAARRRRGG
jgi:hypothetical protein